MAANPERQQMVRFLLGQLDAPERQLIEERLFADDAFYEAMREAEDDLFDAYARGELSAEDRTRFEQRFLSGREAHPRLSFARALSQLASESMPPPGRAAGAGGWPPGGGLARWLPVAAALVLCAGCGWLILGHRRLSGELAAAGARVEALERRALELHAAASMRPPGFVSFLLPAQTLRGPDPAPRVEIPASAAWVLLQIEVEAAAPHDVELRDGEGGVLWRQPRVAALFEEGFTLLRIWIPSASLPPGGYAILARPPSGASIDTRFQVAGPPPPNAP